MKRRFRDHEDEHDPFDPDRVRVRRRVEPRVADLTKPLPAPDPGPAVPRPYAPQKRVRPEAIVPPEDNPMRGWRWLGARLLSARLWPREAITNPVMAYYSGRKRGRLWEDLLGLFPWLVFIAFDAAFMFVFMRDFAELWPIGIAQTVFGSALGLFWAAVMVAMHVRRSMATMPMEELLLTRLKPVDIVQGLAIRPLAVQSAGIFFWSLAAMIMAPVAGALAEGELLADFLIWMVMIGLIRYHILGVAIEIGGAYALRAHLCIRPVLTAALRMTGDLMIIVLFGAVAFGLIALVAWLAAEAASIGGGAPSALIIGFFSLVGVAVLGVLVFALVFLAGVMMRGLGGDAMDWCYQYPDEWWVMNSTEDDRASFERGLLTPWKPMDRDKANFFKPLPKGVRPLPNREDEARRREAAESASGEKPLPPPDIRS